MGFLSELFHVCKAFPEDCHIYVTKRPTNCQFCGEFIPMPEHKCSECDTPFKYDPTFDVGGVSGIWRADCDCHKKETQARQRNGSPIFYELLHKMADVHDRKSHDYASNNNPYGNYHFAGMLSKLFDNPDDSGFVGRLGEKLYRLANIENNNKQVKNESIEDTEEDLCVLMTLWMADRRERRKERGNPTYLLGTIQEINPKPYDFTLKGHGPLYSGAVLGEETASEQSTKANSKVYPSIQERCGKCLAGNKAARIEHAALMHSAMYKSSTEQLYYPDGTICKVPDDDIDIPF